ncbi:YggS family pyridoxal phosphate-dependent enzyme [Hirschia litorea]|uniref:Pyridoxal phosphate homeostasis protein n=1 Tax=Hirschia litorea TaxID=1199156 RepID=A0ABW2IMF5_9PROT
MMQTPELSIRERRAQIISRIETAADSKGLNPSDITLTAVSKVQPDDRVDAMLEAGQRVFGENRVQEAKARWKERKAEYPEIKLRLIGPLQTNKAEEAVALFDVIETIDRMKLAAFVAKAMKAQDRDIELFVQINTGEEEQKAGVLPQDADLFLKEVKDNLGLKISGLMCIPPVGEPAGPHFALLRKIALRNGIANLSMGMSEDFEIAIGFGSTHVRVGSALFGERVTT